MPAEEGIPLRVIGKVRFPCVCGVFRLGRGMIQPIQGLGQRHGILLTGEKLIHGNGGAPGHNGLRVFRTDNVRLPKAQPLGKHPHQCGVEGERTAFKNDGGRQLQSLGESADGLFGNGVEGGQGNIRPLRPLDQQGLDIRLGEHTASAGDAVNRLSLSRQLFKFIRRNIQQRGDLVNKSAGAPGTAAIHPHVRGLQAAGILVIVEEDHLGVLAAQLHCGTHVGIQRPDCRSVGHHLLDVVGPQSRCDGPASRAAHADPETGTGKPPGCFRKKLPDGFRLVGIMSLVTGKQYAVGGWIQNHRFHSGRSHIHAQTQEIGTCICHICIRSS